MKTLNELNYGKYLFEKFYAERKSAFVKGFFGGFNFAGSFSSLPDF